MKLPGVTYTGVQSLAKQDVSAPLRLAQAEAGAADAWSNAMHQGAVASDEIGDIIAKEEVAKGMNAYNTAKLAWLSEQEALDDEKVPAWENGHDRFNSADDAARAEASKFVKSAKGQELFSQMADEANVRYGAEWHNKVLNWKTDDQRATRMSNVDMYTKQRDFDAVDRINQDAANRGIINRQEYEKATIENQANRVTSEYSISIDIAQTPEEFNALRTRLQSENGLDEAQVNRLQGKLENRIIDQYSGMVRGVMAETEANVGLVAAVVLGEEMIHSMASITDEGVDGLTIDARQKNLNAMREVHREWKARLTKQTEEGTRLAGLACVDMGTCLPTSGKSDDQKKHDDYLNVKLGRSLDGKTGVITNGVESGVILANDEKGAGYRSVMVDQAVRSGYVGKATRETMDAGLTSNDPANIRSAIGMYQSINSVSPAAVEATQSGIVKEYAPVMQGLPMEEAVAGIQRYKSMTGAERQRSRESFDAAKYDEDDFNDFMEKTYPDVGFFTDSAPGFKDTFKREMEDVAKMMMPFVGDNPGAAYMAASKVMGKRYGVDQKLGVVVEKPFATSLKFGNIDNGEWAHEIIAEGLPAYNNGEMPETYTYRQVPGFHPDTNPTYIVSWLSEDGEYKAAAAELRFEETDRGKTYFQEEAERKAEERRQNEARVEQDLAMGSQEGWNAAPLYRKMQVLDDIYMGALTSISSGMADELKGAWNRTLDSLTYEGGVLRSLKADEGAE